MSTKPTAPRRSRFLQLLDQPAAAASGAHEAPAADPAASPAPQDEPTVGREVWINEGLRWMTRLIVSQSRTHWTLEGSERVKVPRRQSPDDAEGTRVVARPFGYPWVVYTRAADAAAAKWIMKNHPAIVHAVTDCKSAEKLRAVAAALGLSV